MPHPSPLKAFAGDARQSNRLEIKAFMNHKCMPTMGRGLLLVSALSLAPACTSERVRSLVDDLRFVAASVEPPEVRPGEAVTVAWELADPGYDRKLQYLFLPCTTFPGFNGCIESVELLRNPAYANEDGTLNEDGYRAYLSTYVQRGEAGPGKLELAFTTSMAAMLLLSDTAPPTTPPSIERTFQEAPDETPTPTPVTTLEEVEGQVSLLVCVPGICDALLNEVDAYLAGEPIDRSGQALLEDLSSGAYLSSLPFADNARAVKGYLMSLREEAEQNHNPLPQSVLIEEGTLETPDSAGGPPGRADAAAGSGGTSFIMTLTLDPNALELLPTESTETEPTYEGLTIHWFSTVGSISPQEQRVTELSEPIQTGLRLSADDLSRLETEPQWLYASVTDSRLGAGWLTLPMEVP